MREQQLKQLQAQMVEYNKESQELQMAANDTDTRLSVDRMRLKMQQQQARLPFCNCIFWSASPRLALSLRLSMTPPSLCPLMQRVSLLPLAQAYPVLLNRVRHTCLRPAWWIGRICGRLRSKRPC